MLALQYGLAASRMSTVCVTKRWATVVFMIAGCARFVHAPGGKTHAVMVNVRTYVYSFETKKRRQYDFKTHNDYKTLVRL